MIITKIAYKIRGVLKPEYIREWPKKNECILISSFPRVGNTWLRFLLANYILKGSELVHFNNIEKFMPTLKTDPWLKNVALPEGCSYFCKTHSPYCKNYGEGKVVLITRNPRDALISGYDFFKNNSRFRIRNFRDYLNHPLWGLNGYLHFYDSYSNSPMDVLTIKYEDLKLNTAKTLKCVLKFSGFEVIDKDIEYAVKLSSRENMSKVRMLHGDVRSFNEQYAFVSKNERRECLTTRELDLLDDLLKRKKI